MHLKLSLLFLIAIITFLIACKREENFSSRFTFVNAAISNPAITLKADSLPIISNIRYDSLISGLVVPSGTFGISLFANNVFQTSLLTNLESNQSYLSLVYDSGTSKKFFIRKDALPAAPPEGQCSIRFFNTVFKTTNLYLANDTAKGVIFTQSFANFLSSQAFSTIDTIKRATVRDGSSLRAIDTLPIALRSGKIYTIYYIGMVSDTINVNRKKFIIQLHN